VKERQAWEMINDPNNFTDELEDFSMLNAARKTAMDALYEVEQYRALGTVKEVTIYKEIYDTLFRNKRVVFQKHSAVGKSDQMLESLGILIKEEVK